MVARRGAGGSGSASMKRSTLVATAFAIPPLGLLALLLAYYLPSHDRVHITGIEIKRSDLDHGEASRGGMTRDVRYIMARTVDGGEVRVYRNEDTRFGWPPYFKFDAVDLAAKAADIAKTQPEGVTLVTYYGWHLNLFGLLPNATSLEIIPAWEHRFPWFNLAFVILMYGGIFASVWWLRRTWRRFREKREAVAAAKRAPKNGAETSP